MIKKILIDTDDKLPDDTSFKNVVILIICVIKGGGKFYLQVILEEHCTMNKHGNNMWWKNYVTKILEKKKKRCIDINKK